MDLLIEGSGSGFSIKKLWENSTTNNFPAQEISLPGLSKYDAVIILTNNNGGLPYLYNPPVFIPNTAPNLSGATNYQGTFYRRTDVNFVTEKVIVDNATTTGTDNRYLVPMIIYGVKF